MKKALSEIECCLTQKLAKFIENEFQNFIENNKIGRLLDLYNTYQEYERNGVDYLFCLNKTDDVICCLKGGLTLTQLSDLVIENEEPQKTTLFYFGENHTKNIHLLTIQEFKEQLYHHVAEMAEMIVLYPWVDAYKYFYETFITNIIID